MFATRVESEAEETGVNAPEPTPVDKLGPGEVGYLVTGLKDVHQAKVGDTITLAGKGGATEQLPGYREPKPMVWSGLFPAEGGDYSELREALDRLKLSDAALHYEPEVSTALGFGFRCGFLGLLHMDIVKERLEREFNLELIATAPNVEFRVHRGDEVEIVHNPAEMPAPGTYDSIEEPMVYATMITPADYLGAVMETSQSRRGEMVDMSYITPERVEIHYVLPLAEIVFDFFDQLKSRTKGYASLDYEPWGYQEANLVRVDVLLHGEPVDAFSTIVHRDKAYTYGKQMVERLKELIPRQLFDVAIQAAIGAKIIARETVKAKRKDVRPSATAATSAASASCWNSRRRARRACAGSGGSTCRRKPSSPRCGWRTAASGTRRSDRRRRAPPASTSTFRSASPGAATATSTPTPAWTTWHRATFER